MVEYLCSFHGKLKGAIGISYNHVVKVTATCEAEAQLKCYDTHEHITGGVDGIRVSVNCDKCKEKPPYCAYHQGYKDGHSDKFIGSRSEYIWNCINDGGYPGEHSQGYRDGWDEGSTSSEMLNGKD